MHPYLPKLYIAIYRSRTFLFTEVVHSYLPKLYITIYQLWYIAIYRLHQQRRKDKSIKRSGRTFTKRDQSQTNIQELYDASIRCHICNGIVNLKFGGIQYDHVKDFKTIRETDPLNMKPTHPFCNNNKNKIEEYKNHKLKMNLPIPPQRESLRVNQNPSQLSFWGIEEDFPN